MTDPIDIDILDIVVVVLGALAGLVASALSGMDLTGDWTDILILACAAVPLLLKRALLPTPRRPPHASALARLAYLLTGILGALGLGGAGLLAWSGLREGLDLTAALGSASLPGLLGGALLAVAVVLDRLRPEAL